MALIKCPGCGNDVSTDSLECPKCGEPIIYQASTTDKDKDKERLKIDITTYLIAIGIFSIIPIFVALVNKHFNNEFFFYVFPNVLILVYSIKLLVLWRKWRKIETN